MNNGQPLYGLTARSADQFRQLVADGGATGGRASNGAPARGLTWVKVTGAAVAGWHPALVSIDQAGAFVDGTVAAEVASSDGSTLATGTRYQATRTGDNATTGAARFRAVLTGNVIDQTGGLTVDKAVAIWNGTAGTYLYDSAVTIESGTVVAGGGYSFGLALQWFGYHSGAVQFVALKFHTGSLPGNFQAGKIRAETRFEIGDPVNAPAHVGVTATLAPGMSIVGGIVVSGGSGSFLADPANGLAAGVYP